MTIFICFLQGGSSAPRNAYPGAAPPHIKGTQRPSGPAMTSPAGAISGAPYRGGAGWTQGYAPAQQAYRYTAPLTAQPAYAYTQHTTTTVSSHFDEFESVKFRNKMMHENVVTWETNMTLKRFKIDGMTLACSISKPRTMTIVVSTWNHITALHQDWNCSIKGFERFVGRSKSCSSKFDCSMTSIKEIFASRDFTNRLITIFCFSFHYRWLDSGDEDFLVFAAANICVEWLRMMFCFFFLVAHVEISSRASNIIQLLLKLMWCRSMMVFGLSL